MLLCGGIEFALQQVGRIFDPAPVVIHQRGSGVIAHGDDGVHRLMLCDVGEVMQDHLAARSRCDLTGFEDQDALMTRIYCLENLVLHRQWVERYGLLCLFILYLMEFSESKDIRKQG